MPVISSRPRSSDSAVWLYLRFTLSYREVEELLAERGLDGASACGCGGRSTMRARAEPRSIGQTGLQLLDLAMPFSSARAARAPADAKRTPRVTLLIVSSRGLFELFVRKRTG